MLSKLGVGSAQAMGGGPVINLAPPIAPGGAEIGRNDPCPCGSGKKWKQCGLKNTEEHQANMAAKK